MTKLRGFCGPSYYVSSNPQFDATRAVNWSPVVDENQTGTNQQVMYMRRTPGLTPGVVSQVPGAQVRGGFTASNGDSFYVVGNSLYWLHGAMAPYSAVYIGPLQTVRGRVRFADNGQEMVFVDGPNGYYVNLLNPAAGVTQITDPAFYGSYFVEFYDGYFIFAQPGTSLFYWSNLYAISFNAINFASKSGNADPINALFVFQRQLWLVGTQTTEIWYDVGGTVTFQRIQGPYNEIGCIAPNTLVKDDSAVFWVAGSLRGSATVIMTNGNGYQKISHLPLDRVLQEYGIDIQNSTATNYQLDGSLIYHLNPTGGANGTSSWCYDMTVSQLVGIPQWHEKTFTIPTSTSLASLNGTEQRHLCDVAWTAASGQIMVGDWSSGNVYYFDAKNATDNGNPITRTRQAPHINNEQNRLFHHHFRLLARTGIYNAANVTNVSSQTVHFNNLVFTAAVAAGACTDYGYIANADIGTPSVAVGTMAPNTFSNVTVQGFDLTTTNFGSNAQNLRLTLTPNNPDKLNTFNYIQFTDVKGNTIAYYAASATYHANTPDVGMAQWVWTPQFTYNQMVLTPPSTGFLTNSNLVVQWGAVGNVAVNVSSITANGNQNPGYMSPAFATVFGTNREGAVNTTTLLGATIGSILAGNVADGTPSFLEIYLLGNPPQNLFTSVSGVDQHGAPFTLLTASANNYTPNVLGSGYTWWNWGGLPNPVFPPNGGSSVLTFNGPPAQQIVTTTQVVSSPYVFLSWADDGAFNFGNELALPIGATGQYNTVIEAWRLGYGRNRVYRIRTQAPIDLIDASISLTPTPF